jgi:preprotein translocase subunit SecG
MNHIYMMLKNSDHTLEKCTFLLVQLLLFGNAIVLYNANRKASTRKAHWCIIKHHLYILWCHDKLVIEASSKEELRLWGLYWHKSQ